MGAGPNYYRFETELRRPLGMDNASAANIARLNECADHLISERNEELQSLADALAAPRLSPA